MRGRYEEAEPLVVQGAEAMLGIENTPPERMQEALERVVQLCEAWGHIAEAASWRVRLE